MKEEYNITRIGNTDFSVVKTTTIFGERISAYDSTPDKRRSETIYSGSISDCKAYLDCVRSNLFILKVNNH